MSKNAPVRTLTTRQHHGITAILGAASVPEAAEASGIPQSTLYRWLDDPLFLAELSRAEGQLIDAAVRRLLNIQKKALAKLEQALDDESTPAGVQVRAAIGVMELLLKLRDLRTVEDRLARLEEVYRVIDAKEAQ